MPHQSLDFEKIKIKSERRDKIRKDEFFRFIVLTANSKVLEKEEKRYTLLHTPQNKNCLRLIDDREDDADLLGDNLDVPALLYL